MTLHMLSFDLDYAALARLAARERLLAPGDDLGYATHAAFAAAFGDRAPKPFVHLLPATPGGGERGRLLAYSQHPLEHLLEQARSSGNPRFTEPLRLERAQVKAMPASFSPGTRLRFRVRLRPVTRSSVARKGSGPNGSRAGERDVFLAHVSRTDAVQGATRAACYAEWLDARLREGGCEPTQLALDAFRFCRLMGRDRSSAERRSRVVEGPDAWMSGVVGIRDTDAFSALLARGVGRFRAFGFGMLLLAPG